MWAVGSNSLKISKSSSRSTYKDVVSSLSYLGGSGMSMHAAKAVINLGGLGHQIEFEESTEKITKIDVLEGKEILGSIDKNYLKHTNIINL